MSFECPCGRENSKYRFVKVKKGKKGEEGTVWSCIQGLKGEDGCERQYELTWEWTK